MNIDTMGMNKGILQCKNDFHTKHLIYLKNCVTNNQRMKIYNVLCVQSKDELVHKLNAYSSNAKDAKWKSTKRLWPTINIIHYEQ